MMQRKKRAFAWIAENRTKVRFSLLLNLLVLSGLVLFLRPSYEVNDDLVLSGLINGSMASVDPHMIFLNYLLGVILKFFYRLQPEIPWYALLQYLVVFCSFTGVTCVLFQKMKNNTGIWISALLLVFFGYECYIKVQFTKTSSVAAAAGIFLMFFALDQCRIHLPAYFSGLVLACFGVMYRWRQFFACAAVMTGIGVFCLLGLSRFPKGKRLRQAGSYVCGFGILLALAVGLICFDQYSYDKDPVWSYYREYNLARANLLDYGFPDYKTNQEAYEALGINEDAYHLYAGSSFNDPEKFSLDTMKQIIALKEKTRISKALLVQFLKKFPLNFFQTASFYCFLFLAVLWLFWGEHKKKGWIALFYEAAAFGSVYFYMFYRGRYLVNRVDVGLWFSACLVLTWMYREEKTEKAGETVSILCLSALLLNQSTWWGSWRVNAGSAVDQQQRSILEEMSADKEHLYLAKVGTISETSAYSMFDAMPQGLLSNISWLGGWETNSAASIQALADYGITNPFRDSIDNDKVYLIDNNIKLTMAYIREYYDADAQAVKVKEIGDYKIYQIVSGQTEKK